MWLLSVDPRNTALALPHHSLNTRVGRYTDTVEIASYDKEVKREGVHGVWEEMPPNPPAVTMADRWVCATHGSTTADSHFGRLMTVLNLGNKFFIVITLW